VGIGPRKEYRKIYVGMTDAQRKAYREMYRTFALGDLETNYVTTQMLYLSRIAGGRHPTNEGEWFSHKKMDEVINLLDTEFKGQQVIVWFRFKSEVYEFVNRLRARSDRKALVITGDVDADERHALRTAFVNDGTYDTACMTISTSKRGLDWSSAETEIYYSNEYSSDARTQSEDRIVHPKKLETRLVIDVIMEDTVDEHAVELLRQKKLSSKAFMSKLLIRMGVIRL